MAESSAELARETQLLAQARRVEQRRAWRLRVRFACAVMLGAFLFGLMLGRIEGDYWRPHQERAQLEQLRIEPNEEEVQITLRFAQPMTAKFSAQADGWWVLIKKAQLPSGPRRGRVQVGQQPLAWRIEPHHEDVLLLLTSLGPRWQLSSQTARIGADWQLRLTLRPQ